MERRELEVHVYICISSFVSVTKYSLLLLLVSNQSKTKETTNQQKADRKAVKSVRDKDLIY